MAVLERRLLQELAWVIGGKLLLLVLLWRLFFASPPVPDPVATQPPEQPAPSFWAPHPPSSGEGGKR